MLRDIVYESKKFYRNKEGMVFGLLFPIGFALIYILAFSNLISNETTLNPVPVAVTMDNHAKSIQPVLDRIGQEGEMKQGKIQVQQTDKQESPILKYVVVTKEQGQAYLKDQTVNHVIHLGKKDNKMYGQIKTIPTHSDSLETHILFNVLNSLLGMEDVVMQTIQQEQHNPLALLELQALFNDETGLDQVTQEERSKGTSGYSVFFYACLGYICIYFMSAGSQLVNNNQANFSTQALRLQNAPMTKRRRILMAFIPVYVTSLILVYIVMGMFIVAEIPLGTQIGHIFLLLTIGVTVGILAGMCLATYIKVGQEKIDGMITAITLISGACAGLMAPQLTQYVRTNLSWINRINPIGLITDALYFLNNYPTNQQYWINTALLCVWMCGLAALVWMGSRGESYESL